MCFPEFLCAHGHMRLVGAGRRGGGGDPGGAGGVACADLHGINAPAVAALEIAA